jgi:surfeit locus 1 family protein
MPPAVNFGQYRWSASWGMTLLTLAAVAAFIALGRWQWHRAAEKRTLNAEFSASAATVSDLKDRAIADVTRYTQIRVHGAYDGAHQFLLDNMSYRGQAGYEVLTPLRLDDGRLLLVNRGWLPLTRSRSELPYVGIDVNADLTVTGRADLLPVAAIALGHAAPAPGAQWPKLTSFPTMEELSSALGARLEPRLLLLNPAEPLGFARYWQPEGLGPARHVSYAVQWWSFAALALVLYGFLNRRPAQP